MLFDLYGKNNIKTTKHIKLNLPFSRVRAIGCGSYSCVYGKSTSVAKQMKATEQCTLGFQPISQT